MIIPSDDQWAAVGNVADWLNYAPIGQQIFQLQGFAGTGKTTTVRFAIDELGIDLSRVAFGAYTMKASLLMRRQGLPATTIHKMIYSPVPPDLLVAEQARAEYEKLREQCPPDLPPALWKARCRQLARLMTEARQPHFIINPKAPIRDARLVVLSGVFSDDGEDLGGPRARPRRGGGIVR
jgi:exodeoxyribonuclease-5